MLHFLPLYPILQWSLILLTWTWHTSSLWCSIFYACIPFYNYHYLVEITPTAIAPWPWPLPLFYESSILMRFVHRDSLDCVILDCVDSTLLCNCRLCWFHYMTYYYLCMLFIMIMPLPLFSKSSILMRFVHWNSLNCAIVVCVDSTLQWNDILLFMYVIYND